MLEIILCSLVTILPDYLYRRYRQGKRFGHEITLYSIWFELRFGIIGCLMLDNRFADKARESRWRSCSTSASLPTRLR